MELILQQNLPHQQRAVDAVCNALAGVTITPPVDFYENPQICLADPRLLNNLRELQKDVPEEYRSSMPVENCLNLDVKMETGTGKTYVYTKTIFELHKRYGFNKFVIAVPSLAIKAGTAQFLRDSYARKHFSDSCGYGCEIELGVLEAPKPKKKRRTFFPGEVDNFVRGSCRNARKIYVLLLNMQLLTNAKVLSRDDYDFGVEGFYRPFDALRATHPIVIIDEPHRFSREQSAFKAIMGELKPQCLIRYGATFPETTSGRGKNRIATRDYQNLLYDLNACEAFNQGLIKGLAKEHPNPLSKREEKVKVLSIAAKDSAILQRRRRNESAKSYTLRVGDSLAIVSDAFQGITVQAITAKDVEFSNGVHKATGEEMDVDVYMSSYQESLLRLALDRHFEIERENFCNRMFKIKTLALFFIDDISSYRPDDSGKEPYLRIAFERLLRERIEHMLPRLTERDAQYRSYLEASLADLSACHAGYFSQDNSDSDEDIAREVDTILNGKKQLLSFRNPDGSFNTLRFLFSKWTLKEGWDNPNVFTIAKLRSSGSETSKLQEVGRGLRLPVDENGNRISNEEFHLNYIVDFTEADFAQRLIDQINGEIPQTSEITEERLGKVAQKLGFTSDELFDALYQKHYIDRHCHIRPETRAQFFEEYPLFKSGLSEGKIRDRNREKPKPVKIRSDVYQELRELWEKINQRYLLIYDADLNVELPDVVLALFERPGVFTDVVVTSSRDIVESDGAQMRITSGTGMQYTAFNPIPYGSFLRRISRTTNLPIGVLHAALVAYRKKHGSISTRHFNENTASAFHAEFQKWKVKNLQGRFRYVRSEAPCGATALTYADGTPREEIAQGRIGTKIVPGTPGAKYLYDAFAYDSPLEKENLTADIESVVVYGKIPRNSIAIPTITGGMYSPDFMYVVQKTSGERELNIVVETKDVEAGDELRDVEEAKIECARVFFDNLSKEGYTVHFREQINHTQMAQIISEVLQFESK